MVKVVNLLLCPMFYRRHEYIDEVVPYIIIKIIDMDVICNQSFSLLEINNEYGYKLQDKKSGKDLGR